MKPVECFVVYKNNQTILNEDKAILVQYPNGEREYILDKSTLSYIGKVDFSNSNAITYYPKYEYRGFNSPKASFKKKKMFSVSSVSM